MGASKSEASKSAALTGGSGAREEGSISPGGRFVHRWGANGPGHGAAFLRLSAFKCPRRLSAPTSSDSRASQIPTTRSDGTLVAMSACGRLAETSVRLDRAQSGRAGNRFGRFHEQEEPDR